MIKQLFRVSTLLLFATSQTMVGQDMVNAKKNYLTFCSGCHGEKIEVFADRKWKKGSTKPEIMASIATGNEEEGMPPFEAVFSDEDMGAIADYILEGIANVGSFKFEDKPSIEELCVSKDQAFTLDTVVSGLDVPWGLEFLPNGDLLINEKSGKLILFEKESDTKTEVGNVPEVRFVGQGGLLDIELHPQYEENGWIYLSYSLPEEGDDPKEATTAVDRAKLKDGVLVERENIFTAMPFLPTRHHYGSRLEFDKDGYLFISVGDRGRRDDNPQNLDNHCGKIHRVHADGTIPEDNPFVSEAPDFATIWSYGHRNPQGLSIHPTTGELWDNEHGPKGGDEINRIEKGKNYGWPVISYGINYDGTTFTTKTSQEGMEQPDYYWVPSIGVCGMTFVSGGKYPGWEGDIMSGSLKYQYLHRTKMNGNKVASQELLLKKIGRVRTIEMGPDGYLYLGVEKPMGAIIRLLPSSAKS